jgi:hypothetical protein
MKVPTLAALVAVATMAAAVSLPAEAGGNGIWSQIQALKNQGYHKKFIPFGFKLTKKTETSTPYTIEYRSPNNPMEDNPCWTEQKLAFHQYVAGTCVYDPDMYKSLINESGGETNCTKSTVKFKFDWYNHEWDRTDSSSTTSGSCPTHGGYGGHHGGGGGS